MNNVRNKVLRNDNYISIPICAEDDRNDLNAIPCYVTVYNEKVDLDEFETLVANLLTRVHDVRDSYLKQIYDAERQISTRIDNDTNKQSKLALLNSVSPQISSLYECINDFFEILEEAILKIQETLNKYKNARLKLQLIADTFTVQEYDPVKNNKKATALIRRLTTAKKQIVNAEINVNNAVFQYNKMVSSLQGGLLVFPDSNDTVNIRRLLAESFGYLRENQSYLKAQLDKLSNDMLQKGYALEILNQGLTVPNPIPEPNDNFNVSDYARYETMETENVSNADASTADKGKRNLTGLRITKRSKPTDIVDEANNSTTAKKIRTSTNVVAVPSSSTNVNTLIPLGTLPTLSDNLLITYFISLSQYRAYEGDFALYINEYKTNFLNKIINENTKEIVSILVETIIGNTPENLIRYFENVPQDQINILQEGLRLKDIIATISPNNPFRPKLMELANVYSQTFENIAT